MTVFVLVTVVLVVVLLLVLGLNKAIAPPGRGTP